MELRHHRRAELRHGRADEDVRQDHPPVGAELALQLLQLRGRVRQLNVPQHGTTAVPAA